MSCPTTRRHRTARALAGTLLAGCVAVTACGLNGSLDTSPELVADTLPPPEPPPVPAPEPAVTTSEADPAAAWAFVDQWWQAEQWQAAADYAVALVAYVHALQAAAAPQAQPPRATFAGPQRPTQPVSGGAAPGGFLACVRNRESRGNYQAVNPSSGAGGAYQFLPSTWHAMGGTGLPQNASPAEQDRIAAKTYASQGRAPWAGPGC